MASEESEVSNRPNGNYINSFFSFLKVNGEGQNLSTTELSGVTGEPNTNSTEKMNEDSSHGNEESVESPDSVNDKDNDDGSSTRDRDGAGSVGTNDDAKDSDFNYNSENDSRSSLVMAKSTAKRGRKRKLADANLTPQRETPRRAARKVKCYVDEDLYNDIDETRASDPDYDFSDSDDDPDFDPSEKKGQVISPETELRMRKAKPIKGKGKGRGIQSRSAESTDEDSNSPVKAVESNNEDSNSTVTQRRRGRPPVYGVPNQEKPSEEISDNTVSSTDDTTKSSGKLSSAYNYATTRTRQNQAIRLPEGPNLTEEQLKLIESQFKSGDFVMAKKDTDMMEHPPIWRIDGKSLLQKFQAFEKDGKMLYRNISTYSGWTSQAKALYVPVKVNFVFQSRYDTVVELVGFKGVDNSDKEPSQIIDKPVWIPKKDIEISDELRVHMPSFEIYLQTLISQALDNNFLQEIYEENDAYFVDRVKVIDELTDQRKDKILKLAKWDSKFQTSLDTWPCVNTMITKTTDKCQACTQDDATMLSQFYGQPYDHKTLRSKEPTIWDLDHKNFETCDSCSVLSQLYNKVAHQKYDYYSQCKSTVTNMRVSHPNKSTTNVLRDLLANDEWITGLFRAMCTTWVKVDNVFEERTSTSSAMENPKSTTEIPEAEPPTIITNEMSKDDDPDDPDDVVGSDVLQISEETT